PDAGVALRVVLVALAEPARLVANVHDLDTSKLEVDAPSAQPQQLPAAKPGGDVDDEVVSPEGSDGRQQPREVLRREHARLDVAEHHVRIQSAPRGLDLADGLAAIRPSSSAAWRMRYSTERQSMTSFQLRRASRSCCQRRTSCGVMALSW